MKRFSHAIFGAVILSSALPVLATAADAPAVSIPFETFTLDNGLRVVVHEDRKAPVVAVSIWYHVGSKDEPEGKTGFAHLFEHLMFNGSENYDDEWFLPLEEVGATSLNGTTWFDRTNYYQTVPTPALDRVLWMESDRMGHLLGAVTQEKLDNQRGVVQNEKRQGDNQPYGRMEYAQLEGLLPAAHPYRHSTIGSMEDLDAASLETVKEWFTTYYGASNVVLSLAGDIDAATAKPLIEKYFGDIDAGPPLNQKKAFAPLLEDNRFETMYDQVAQPRIERQWVAPGRVSRELAMLDLATTVLGSGKTSRLYQKLVDQEQIATRASSYVQPQELMSFLAITVDPKADADLDKVTSLTNKVLADFLSKGPSKEELERAKTVYNANIIRSVEDVSGKAFLIAEGELYAGDPGFYTGQYMQWVNEATPADVLAAAKKYFGAGYFELTVLPFPDYQTVASNVDRSTGLPAVGDTPELVFPQVEEATLSNGIKVVLANRPTIPVVEMAMVFDAGYAADQAAINGRSVKGLSNFTMTLLDEGTKKRSATKIASDLESLGATLNSSADLDTSTVYMSALKSKLTPSLDIMTDVIMNAEFAQSEIDKTRNRWLASIEREKTQPVQIALRLLPPMIYGKDHAYGLPFTGSGYADDINAITRNDLIAFRQAWLRPEKATLFVAGDATMAEMLPVFEKSFGKWAVNGPAAPAKNLSSVSRPATSKVVIVDKPGAPQSLILAGHAAPAGADKNAIVNNAMNDILGGQFTARVNMNLREDKGWAYGAYTFLYGARGMQPFMVYAPVQTDRTGDSLTELQKEMTAFLSTKPATADELQRVVLGSTRSLPGSYETAGAVIGSMMDSNNLGRPYSYPASLTARYNAITLSDINTAAKEVVHPESLIWVIVGDWKKIEPQISGLNLGEVTLMSADQL